MALPWLSGMEILLFEALVEETEWTASMYDRAAALPKVPLDLNPFLSFLLLEVGGFIAPTSRGISFGFMTSKTSDKILTVVHISVLRECVWLSRTHLRRPNSSKISKQSKGGLRILSCRRYWRRRYLSYGKIRQ